MSDSFRLERFDLIGCEVQVPAVPLVHLGGRVVLDDDADVLVAVDVLVHRGDACDLVREEDVLGIGPPRRVQPDPAARD